MTRILPAVAVLGVLCSGAPAMGADWPTAAPEAHGFNSARFAEVVLAARASGQPIHGVTMVRGGDVILDAAFYPYDPATLHDMASVTKSVTTSLVAIAAAEGKLDLDAAMVSFFTDREFANRSARKDGVTVRQLTQNTSGLACIGYPEEVTLARMEGSDNFVQFALDLPMAAEPGKRFDYCSPGMHILSAIVQQATGKSAFDYAKEKLFGPLGITQAAWDADPQGVTRGWGDLHLVPQDMIKLGALWLSGGTWQGRQIIPADWLATATTKAIKSDRYEDYGYGFWVGPKDEPIPYFFASGRGGQRILAAPALDLIITTTGGGFDPGAIIDPLMTALTDPAKALPPNPAGEERLRQAVAAAASAPAATPVAPMPEMAARVSGKTYAFPANPFGLEAIRVAFADAKTPATLAITDPSGTAERPVGLDGVYRWSTGPNDIRYGVAARWTDPSTLELDYNTIGDIRAYTITAVYTADTLEMTIAQRDEHMVAKLVGRAR